MSILGGREHMNNNEYYMEMARINVKRQKTKKYIKNTIVIFAFLSVCFILFFPLKNVSGDDLEVGYISYESDDYSWDAFRRMQDTRFLIYDNKKILEYNEDNKKYGLFRRKSGYRFQNFLLVKEGELSVITLKTSYFLNDYSYHLEETDEGTIFVLDSASTKLINQKSDNKYDTFIVLRSKIDGIKIG